MKKSYTISIPVRTFWTVWLPLAVLSTIGGGIVGVVVMDRLVMPNLPGISSRGVVSVPLVAGHAYEDARQRLYEVGLRTQVLEREYSTVVNEGRVISQKPEAGESVKKGRHVCLVLSKGPEVDTVPQVRRQSENTARRALRDKGFVNVRVRKAYNETTPADQVAHTVPQAGSVTSREIEVDVVVSKGPKPTHAEVPNLVGELLSEARAQIEESGLKPGNIDFRNTSSSRPGTIVSQSLSPGTSVPLESTVNLVVAGTR